ncbi:MAG: SurA N-terminal domain-containing protein [Prevotellaceae bacterium]|jgi:peptidyl-prolyl cis-trans isomerase D|nr:SurA N-terminal domain-containing protein [Prevotellaceae bacterium]
MATLEKIRTRGGVFIAIIIGIALLSFIVSPDSLQRASMMFSSKYDAGEIAGKSISYQVYQQQVDYQTALYEMNMGGRANMNEQVTEQIREQVWQEFIKEYVLYKEFDKIGLAVSDDELTDLVSGNNPSPMIRQIFTNQETGQFDRGRLVRTIQSLDADPNLKAQWLSIEEQMKDNQLYTKFSNLIAKSTLFNSIDIDNSIAASSNNVEFSYIVKPYMVIDTISQVNMSELKKYYNDNKKLYEQSRSRDIQYISLPIVPSADDYRLAMETIQKIETDFISTPVTDLGMFVNRNSEKVFDDIYHKRGELPLAVDTFAFNEELGAFLPIYQEGDTYNMSRISGIKNMPDSVHARHILLAPENFAKADSLVDALKNGADFVTMANQYSIDQAANQNGGDLGWFTFRNMVRPFSDSCFFNNPKGKITKVRTQYGDHVIQILDKGSETKHVQVATIQISITAGKITSQNIFNQANAIAAEANNDQTKFLNLASERGLFAESGSRIGLNDRRFANFNNVRELIRWVYDAKVGDVSDVFEIDNNYFVVATLTAIREDGTAPFEQMKNEIEVAVKKDKQAKTISEELKTAMQLAHNSIDELAVKTGLQVATVSSPINFMTSYISGIMAPEPKLIGAVTSASENTLSGPVVGANGVYVFTVTNKTTKEDFDKEAEKVRLQNMVPMQAYEFYNILINKANIKDNRGKFY